jgi:hypothetical protein
VLGSQTGHLNSQFDDAVVSVATDPLDVLKVGQASIIVAASGDELPGGDHLDDLSARTSAWKGTVGALV